MHSLVQSCIGDIDGLIDSDDDYEFESMDDVNAYIQAVKTEADNLPEIARDPAAFMKTSKAPDICSADSPPPDLERSKTSSTAGLPEGPREITPYIANTLHVLSMLNKLRAKIRSVPKPKLGAVPAWKYRIPFPEDEAALKQFWRRCRKAAPTSAVLARMNNHTVLTVLEYLTRTIETTPFFPATTSAWFLGLLAALPGRLELSNESHARLRSIGIAATRVTDSLVATRRNGEVQTGSTAVDEGEGASRNATLHEETTTAENRLGVEVESHADDEHPQHATDADSNAKTEAEELARAKAKLVEELNRTTTDDDDSDDPRASGEPASDWDNTTATLDMIATVVGIEFGQLDLVRFSPLWD